MERTTAEVAIPRAEHGSSARVSRALRAGAGQSAVRFAGLSAGLVTIPLAIDGLGRERFGVWLTVSSVTVLLGSADLGLGNALITAVAAADGRGDTQARSQLVASAFAGLLGVAALIMAFGSGLALLVDWNDLFGISTTLASPAELQTAMLATVAGVAVGVAASVGPRTQEGMQQGATVAIWQVGGAATQVGFVSLCWRLDLGLVAYCMAPVAASAVGSIAASAALFVTRPDLRPRFGAVHVERIRDITRTGFVYFVLAISAIVAYQIDTLVIASRLGADSAATYGVAYRVMGFASLLTGVFLTPFWPAYAEARAAGDVEWVRATFRRTLRLSFMSCAVLGGVLFAAAPFLIRIWTDDAIQVPRTLLIVLFIFALEMGLSIPLAMLLNGLAHIKLQAVLSIIMAAVNLILSILLADKLGISGPPLATVIAQALIILGPTWLIVRRLLATLDVPTTLAIQD